MTDARDRNLVEAVRAELAAIDPPRTCCRSAERAGLGVAATGQARSPSVARLAVRLAERTPAHAPAVDSPFGWTAARAHCRAAWLRGRFLSVGSLSLGAGGVHLEFVLPAGEGSGFVSHLADADVPATWRVRRGRDVVTAKRIEAVLALLRSCGAAASVLEIESLLVERQMHGHLNRVLNAETANLQRSVASSARQMAVIEQLLADGRLAELGTVERAVARGRLETPEASFSELSERIGVSRTRVQRAFARLESVAGTDGTDGDL